MVEYVEELRVEAHLQALRQRNPFRQVEVAPRKLWTPQRVAAEISELTIPGAVPTEACTSTRVNRRGKSIRVEPLNRSRLGDTGNRFMFIERNTRNHTGELRPTTVDNAISIC